MVNIFNKNVNQKEELRGTDEICPASDDLMTSSQYIILSHRQVNTFSALWC